MRMIDPESLWRAELEAVGESAVRDNINRRGSLVTDAGEARQQFIRKWLREKDLERETRERRQLTGERPGFDYAQWALYIAAGALIAAILAIVVKALLV
jgi:hypothetical protein